MLKAIQIEKTDSSSHNESTSMREAQAQSLKGRKYNTIDFEKRKQLIRRVIKNGEKLRLVAAELDIKLSTSKFILKIFKKQGRIFKKKSNGEFQESDSEIQQLKQTLIQNAKKNAPQVEYVYVPYYLPILVEKEKETGQMIYSEQQPFLMAGWNSL